MKRLATSREQLFEMGLRSAAGPFDNARFDEPSPEVEKRVIDGDASGKGDMYIPREIKAWQYNAGYHCPFCANQRFGGDALRDDTAVDSEGNHAHPLFSTDEWQQFNGEREILTCDDCQNVIDQYFPVKDGAPSMALHEEPKFDGEITSKTAEMGRHEFREYDDHDNPMMQPSAGGDAPRSCPRCGSFGMGDEYPAISRTDNQTEICSDCGHDEALREHQGLFLQFPDEWPVR